MTDATIDPAKVQALIEHVDDALAGVSEITNCRKWKERGCDCRLGGELAGEALAKLRDALAALLRPNTEEETLERDLAALTALMAKWREAASWEVTDGSPAFGQGLDQCADELEAVLARAVGPPEQNPNAHALTLEFKGFLSQREWREVVEAIKQGAAGPYIQHFRADAIQAGPAAVDAGPLSLNAEQEQAAKEWAADDRFWTTQDTVEFNLRTFARVILKAAVDPPEP